MNDHNWSNNYLFTLSAFIGKSVNSWKVLQFFPLSGGGQNIERRNIERPIFRNFKIANIKITKDELFDNFIFKFNVSFCKNNLNTQNI